jgi:hypothetical protein
MAPHHHDDVVHLHEHASHSHFHGLIDPTIATTARHMGHQMVVCGIARHRWHPVIDPDIES